MSQTRSAAGNSEANADSGSPTTDRLAVMAHETIDRVAETADHVEHDLRGAAAKSAETAKHAQNQAAAAADENLRKVRSYIGHNPLAAAGIAFAAGAFLSALIRR